jgi:hypothetical protein
MAPVMRSPGALPRGLRLAFVLLLVAGFFVAGAPARACSCAEIDIDSWLSDADGAFVGRWLDRAEIGDGMAAVTFEVERVVKGSFGPTAIVRTNAQGSACGLEPLGRSRTGLILQLHGDGVWSSGLCSMVPPAQLLAVGGDRPPDPDVAAVSAGWSPSSKALASVVVTVALMLLVLVWFARRRAATTGGSDVA